MNWDKTRDWIFISLIVFVAGLFWNRMESVGEKLEIFARKMDVLITESVYSKNQVEDHERRIRDLEDPRRNRNPWK